MEQTIQSLRSAQALAASVMKRYSPEKALWHYEHGVLMQSLLALGLEVEDQSYEDFVVLRMQTLVTEGGEIPTYRLEDYNLDQINPGKVLLELYARRGEERYKKAAQTLRYQLQYHPRTSEGGFWHKKIYPHQIWLDGQYMQGPFYARYARDFNEPAVFDDVTSQLLLTEARTRNPSNGLLYHAWDESRKQLWANLRTGCSPHFWGRAMGWFAMALVDVLDMLPAGHSKWEEIIQAVRRLAGAVLDVQDREVGLWYQVLDQGEREKNYIETSASSMFTYFLAKAARLGYLEEDVSVRARRGAQRALQALIDDYLIADREGDLHLHGICSVAGLGGTPYRDGSYDYYVKEPVAADDFKGVGPFIMACIEVNRL
ncbi:glycoside hydrolase family 88/105 protein [Spirochaeta lutea]|uniref:Glycosyl hydrolase family 88 n=1 Tax=Spirochaeta lutea TaxID=1480694 RepID=A0A098QZA0_9SPIO|nr:glycoside hydrolase family 88 protein [Spirochaeta lutea]KGE72768.1 hypothetical protein DC28_05885 [Spirochaeta lutea]